MPSYILLHQRNASVVDSSSTIFLYLHPQTRTEIPFLGSMPRSTNVQFRMRHIKQFSGKSSKRMPGRALACPLDLSFHCYWLFCLCDLAASRLSSGHKRESRESETLCNEMVPCMSYFVLHVQP